MPRSSKYSPELRERAVRMVFEHAHEHSSQWATMRSVAEKLGCTVEALRRWVRQAERDSGKRPGLTTSEREELKRLQRENVELKRANEILRKASAFFATPAGCPRCHAIFPKMTGCASTSISIAATAAVFVALTQKRRWSTIARPFPRQQRIVVPPSNDEMGAGPAGIEPATCGFGDRCST